MGELPAYVDVAKLNIEGGELDLLPATHAAGLMQSIDQFFIQFHSIASPLPAPRISIQRMLSETHVSGWGLPLCLGVVDTSMGL
jgi:hypothetical protein